MDSIGDRFRAIRERLGFDKQAAYARNLEINPSLVSDIERGDKEPSKNVIIALIQRHGVNANWLLTGLGPMEVPAEWRNISPKKEPGALSGETFRRLEGPAVPQERTPSVPLDSGTVYRNADGKQIFSDDFVAVNLLSQKVSAGPGQEVLDFDTPVSVIPVLRRMLRGFDPKGAFGAEVDGDSMTGEKIFGGDIVIFYRGLVKDNGLYVLFRDGGLFVKRLTFSFTTKRIKITSANERYPEVEEVEDSQALTIAGKVLGWVHVHPY